MTAASRPMVSRSDPAHHYDRITPAWSIVLGEDFHHGLYETGTEPLTVATEAMTRRLARAAGVAAGDRVLDVGCGIGGSACWLAAECDASVLGISTSGRGIELARERAAARGLADRVEFAERDALETGLPDASFDVVWLLEVAQYLVPKERMMSECARLLAPGGRLVLADVVLRRELTLRDLRARHHELSILRDTFGDAQMIPPDEYAALAAEAGLAGVEVTDLSQPIRPTFADWRGRAEQAHDRVVAAADPTMFERFVAACEVMEQLLDAGIIGYTLITARRPGAADGADPDGPPSAGAAS